MIACGIDIGLSGGVAFLSADGKVLRAEPMPTRRDAHGKLVTDALALYEILAVGCNLTGEDVGLTALEWVHSFGTESRSSVFSFGSSAGRVLAVLEILQLPFEEPTPQAWKAEVLAGTKKDKAAAIGYCKARWPSVSLRFGASFKDHDGVADALCLAEFARRRLLGK